VAARSKVVEQAADELYALPPAEFTGARDDRAKALRKEGHRDEADAVKALRKPTVAAGALNQLARQRPNDVEGLIAAGEELSAAQEELLAGGDRKAFQSAAARERDQVAKLAREAMELASGAGERPSPALTEKIAATLHAAALDEETAEELRAGRLVREREAIGGFGAISAEAPPRSRGAPAKRSEPAKGRTTRAGGATARRAHAGEQPASDGGKRSKAGSAEGKRGEARSGEAKRIKAAAEEATRRKAAGGATRGKADEAKRLTDAVRREEAERRQRLAAARTDERHARRELEATAKTVEHAETRAEAARAHAEEANRRAKTTAERLKDARRAQAAAKKAHARAERALEAVERGS
jgi:hypothetical protein